MRLGSNWRPIELVEETWRRLTRVHLGLAFMIGLLATGILLVNVQELSTALVIVDENKLRGENIFVIAVPDEESLDSTTCESLSRQDWVETSGSVFGENVAADATWEPAGVRLSVIELSQGALGSWWPDAPNSGGVFVGNDLSGTLGISPKAKIASSGELTTINDSLPLSVTPKNLQASIVRVVPAVGAAQECWFRVTPLGQGSAGSLAQVRFPNNTMLTAAYARGNDLAGDPEDQLFTSQGLTLWVGAVGVALIFIAFVGLSRRSEVGIYRALGTRWSEVWFMAVLQIFVLTALSTSLVVASSMLWLAVTQTLPLTGDIIWYLTAPVASYALIVCAAGPLIQTLAASGKIVNTMKN